MVAIVPVASGHWSEQLEQFVSLIASCAHLYGQIASFVPASGRA